MSRKFTHISRREKPSLWLRLVHLVPALPLVALLLAILVRDACHESAPPPLTVVIAPEPHLQRTGVAQPPVFKAVVADDVPEFDPTLAAAAPVRVTIIDDKEELPPVKQMPVKVTIKDEGNGEGTYLAARSGMAATVDTKPRIEWKYGPAMRFGFSAVETRKRLTFSPDGATNQTMLRVNGETGEFGGPKGSLLEQDAKMAANPQLKTYGGSKTVWVSGKIHYTQLLEIVPSQQPVMVGEEARLLLDTVRVRYVIENKDSRTFTVGLRLQIDTLIGSNDGVPFTVPGLPGMVVGFADFPKLAKIPDFLQALERPDLQNPGTVAQMSLKLGGGIEPPGRVSLTHWPGGSFAGWDVPLVPIGSDSAVVLYWLDKPLKPGARGEMGFAYGLGSVASGSGKLGLTLGGSFEPGEAFTATAYVQDTKRGETLTLELPAGLERLEGSASQVIPPPTPGAASSIVTWKVKVLKTGTFPIKVVSSSGLTQSRTIAIERPDGLPEARLELNLAGQFEPGQEFTAQARLLSNTDGPITDPVLALPRALIPTGEPTITHEKSPNGKGGIHTAVWRVKVLEAGTHAIRATWSGVSATKTLSIEQDESRGGYFSMALAPPFAPGKAFTVAATVTNPIPGQTLTLQLPAELQLIEGQEMVTVPAGADGPPTLTWQVLVPKPGTFPVRILSSTGLALKKTIVIVSETETGGAFKLECIGDIGPGKEFTVQAKVTNPLENQKLTLQPLPPGLKLVQGPATQAVPDGKGIGLVTWRLRVLDKGTLPVRIASTTGVVQSFTITILPEATAAGTPQLFGGKR